MTPAPVPAVSARASRTALLWRLGLLLLLVLAVLTPAPFRAGGWFVWGAAAGAALLAALAGSAFFAPADPGGSPAPPAPRPPGGARGGAPVDPGVSSSAQASAASPVAGSVGQGGLVALPLLCLVGGIVYGGVAGPLLWGGNLALAGSLAAPLVAVSLAVLLPGHDPAAAARSWGVAVGVALWAALGTVATAELAARPLDSISALVPLLLALGAWSAVRRAVRMQGMGGRWPEALGTGVGLTALVMTTSVGVAQLLLGFVVGLVLAQEADRLIPVAALPGAFATIRAELIAVQQQLVFAAPLVLLALTLLPPR